MSDGNSLVNLGDLGKPINTLIEKIASATGALYQPTQIKRIARAEAAAALIKAESENQVGELHRRTAERLLGEETKRQQNMDGVTAKAASLLNATAQPEKMDDDWVAGFFEKCRLVSNQEMQQLWAKVLAGEANQAGSFSRRTVDFLSSMSKADAEALTALMRFAWDFSKPQPLIYDHRNRIYQDNGLTFKALTHLDAIGLVRFQGMASYQVRGLPHRMALAYQFNVAQLEFPGDDTGSNNSLSTGQIALTQIGEELGTICKAPEVPGYFDYVLTHWKALGIKAEKVGSLSPDTESTP